MEFYYCYSPNQHDFLRKHGVRYICAGLNESTMRKFWQYRRDERLNELLTQYAESNPNK